MAYLAKEEVKIILDRVISDSKERERSKQEEREERMAREARQHELELRKLELSHQNQPLNDESGRRVEIGPKIQLTQITTKFDEKHDEISLYLINFERKAELTQVPKQDWVAYLLAVLPAELSNMLARKPTERANNYDFVKYLILKRYRLNSEKFKQCFYRHQKSAEKSWRNYAHELNSYFSEWIAELQVKTFEQLKDLLITEQLKYHVPAEVREHFLDDWIKLKTPYELAEKLDEYESIKQSFRRETPEKNSYKFQGGVNYSGTRPKETPKDFKSKFQIKEEPVHEKNHEKDFEKRKQLRCYECGSYSHLRPQCDKLKKNYETVASNETIRNGTDVLAPYTSLGTVNGIEMPILRDTGATLDLICKKYVKPSMFINETVWIRTPLEETAVCLPMAEVELDCVFGHVITKAAVLRDSLDQGKYLLGNKTAALFEEVKKNKEIQVYMVNAVETRSQKKLTEESKQDLKMSEETIPESNEKNKESPDELDDILPLIQPEISESNLIKLSHKDFAKEQMNSAELKTLFEEAKSGSSKKNHYIVENNLLFFQKEDKDGTKRKCLVVPEKYRKNLMTIGHEAAAAHLGVTKTKDAIFKTFYWPKCFSDVEDFVKTCDKCQRVSKPQDKKKAPLKIVPVITEIFTNINIDASGPLPMTPSGNKYIITALCMSSRYPDALPVGKLCSTTVVNALLQIFSRMGFPRELQTDQGTSFMSALTTEFLERFGVKKRILRVLCLEAIPDWEKILPQALFALRTVIHDSTGFSSAELVSGKNLRTPVMLLCEKLTEGEHVESSVVDYVFELINRMKRCQELAILHMEDAKQKQKLWYDRRTVKRQFQLGELVLVTAPSRPNKLSVQWVGPGEIVQHFSETNYVVKFPEKDKIHVYHVNMLKPYHQREENINLLCINPLKHDEEEDISSLELENERSGWSKIISDVQLNSKLSQIQRGQFKELLYEYSNLFSNIPGCTYLAEHDIELESERAIVAKPYRMSPRQIEILKSEVNKMLELKKIEPGESDFTSPLILVEAQGKEARPCIDYRRLNKVTWTQFFPLPNIEELLEKVSAAKYTGVQKLRTRRFFQYNFVQKLSKSTHLIP
ncbi:retrovirus-related Pol polyprotein from transposon 412 [Trichonephila clavipes]|nr:retrovirus-related Pol polyprotein from transposon 412 [Trichonephila clavipes]